MHFPTAYCLSIQKPASARCFSTCRSDSPLGSPQDPRCQRAAQRGFGCAVHAGREACLELRPCFVKDASQDIEGLGAEAKSLVPHFCHEILPDRAVFRSCRQHTTLALGSGAAHEKVNCQAVRQAVSDAIERQLQPFMREHPLTWTCPRRASTVRATGQRTCKIHDGKTCSAAPRRDPRGGRGRLQPTHGARRSRHCRCSRTVASRSSMVRPRAMAGASSR